MKSEVRPKKHLGQHFLADENMAKKIASSIEPSADYLLEIGPGTGSLTKHLIDKWGDKLWVAEIDKESVEYLNKHYPALSPRIIEGDVLRLDLNKFFEGKKFNVIGNFPYNISSQILFKVLEYRKQVIEVVGMFQKEVAKRICSPPGNKDYGILSVLIQAHFDTAYLFNVPPSVFIPPPAVDSGVIKLIRKQNTELGCNEELFTKVVKTAFNQRRKKLSNALSSIIGEKEIDTWCLGMRAEQLSWQDFAELTNLLEKD
jgi:16S rRNA (adenine1518-N6/adenine1519-N6)-dimethyltransferase